ncbi:MAG: biopolymer transporter ExbD [Phycisphaerales bacterium]|nr:MAG: biopolymer transporter ExbD [Phycisphaerales bacterium]
MRFRPKHRPVGIPSDLPMTSMIDVVFLLLIFFMITATFVRERELRSTLDAVREGAGSAADLSPQIVEVELRNGRSAYRIGARIMRTQEELFGVLTELPKEGGVFIRVHGDAPWGAAAGALQAAQDAGFLKRTYVPAD